MRAFLSSTWAWSKGGVWLLLGVHGALLVWGAFRQSPTVDEPVHLASGLRRLQQGRFDLNRGNPPLVGTVAALPLIWAHPVVDWHSAPDSHAVGMDFVSANGSRSFWLMTVGRLACIPFSLLAGYVCFRWARELYGTASGYFALTLWSFSPNAIGYGQLISGDMGATALGVLAFYTFWKWLRAPSLKRSAFAGLALGLAELTKYVWVLLYALWPMLWIAWKLPSLRQTSRGPLLRELGQLLLLFALSVYVINLGYLFDGSLEPLERFRIGQKFVERLGLAPETARLIGALPLPLPKDYLLGIDEIQQFCERRPWSYLWGEFRPGGWWYFYPCALAVKLPLGTIYLVALGALLSFDRRFTPDWRTDLLIVAGVAAIVCFVTCSNSVQTFRYILPVVPLVVLLAAKAGQAFRLGDKVVSAIACVGLSWSVLTGLYTYPHSLSYFNEVAGGPTEGHEWLAESDIDWGQDLLYLKQWLARHLEAKPFYLAYFGCIDPRLAGIDYSLPPPIRASGSTAHEQTPTPGWYAVSVNLLRGFSWIVPDGMGSRRNVTSDYVPLLRLRPVAMAGYSIYIYHVDENALSHK